MKKMLIISILFLISFSGFAQKLKLQCHDESHFYILEDNYWRDGKNKNSWGDKDIVEKNWLEKLEFNFDTPSEYDIVNTYNYHLYFYIDSFDNYIGDDSIEYGPSLTIEIFRRIDKLVSRKFASARYSLILESNVDKPKYKNISFTLNDGRIDVLISCHYFFNK